MALPITIPFTFGNATTTQSLSSLDTNFTTITNSVNGLTNGASQINVASISATGTANATTYLRGDGSWSTIAGGGSGTVTSVDVNGGTTGLTTSGGPVTTSGNITISGTLVAANGGTGVTSPGTSGNVLTSTGTGWISKALTGGTGTVTSITAGTGLSGGTITTSGTIALVTTLGAVGTYAILANALTPLSITAGASVAGSSLRYAGASLLNPTGATPIGPGSGWVGSATAPSGTWQAMGNMYGGVSGCNTYFPVGLWIRTA
jgi:hypothetical protein